MLTWFTGREAVVRFVAANLLAGPGQLRLREIVANGQPAFAVYRPEEDGTYLAHAVLMPTVTATGFARLVAFQDPVPSPWLRAGAAAWPRPSSASTRRSRPSTRRSPDEYAEEFTLKRANGLSTRLGLRVTGRQANLTHTLPAIRVR
ncbi:MAG: hypothetical protein ACRDRJ_07595 [Streptosporangiaceae bacterium]